MKRIFLFFLILLAGIDFSGCSAIWQAAKKHAPRTRVRLNSWYVDTRKETGTVIRIVSLNQDDDYLMKVFVPEGLFGQVLAGETFEKLYPYKGVYGGSFYCTIEVQLCRWDKNRRDYLPVSHILFENVRVNGDLKGVWERKLGVGKFFPVRH